MAFEDVYGDEASVSYDDGVIDSINDSYVAALLSLLPPGQMWEFESTEDFYELLLALSYALLRVADRAADLLEEFDPRTTYELLADWERVLDLPRDNPDPPTTTAGRRSAIHAQLLGNGDPSVNTFEEVADGAGFPAVVSNAFYRPFVPGSRAGEALHNNDSGGWSFVWRLFTVFASNTDFLEWFIDSLAPAHAQVLYKYINLISRTAAGFAGEAITASGYSTTLFAIGGSAGKLATSPRTSGAAWTARTSNFGADQINSFAHDGSIWVAAGVNGKISSSTDGVTWTARTSNFGGEDIRKVYATDMLGTGIFVAVGDAGKVSTSPDGITWTARTSNFGTSDIYDVVFANGVYIIAGESGKIASSPDAITWTLRTSGITGTIRKLFFGENDSQWGAAGNTIVAIGGGATDFELATSNDGIGWAPRTLSGAGTLIDGVWGRVRRRQGTGAFVVIGGSIAYTSLDGTTWTSQTIGANIARIDYVNGLFMISQEEGQIHISTDGVVWAEIDDLSMSAVNTLLTSPKDEPNQTAEIFIIGGDGAELYVASLDMD
jgi:uncharacterized protein YmfQ (DUF2313 family)